MQRLEINIETGESRTLATSAWLVNGELHFFDEGADVPDGATRPMASPAAPVSCSPWQIRKALNQLGLRAGVEAAVAAGSQEMQDGWEFATEFRSDDPLALAIGAALGKSPAEVREIIDYAATL